MPKMPQQPMTAAEAAALLGVSLRTIQRRAKTGQLPYYAQLPGQTGAYLFDRTVIETLASTKAA